ncbi:zinc finger protein-like 1 homolog [Dendronephthya gigantea]|uniref:zinc finger protein-like 1 homolog n=1 Tax=Dendronephthya gigantea TaxID=151771 RepID=UPI00106D9953|nr:zinc finger protein-like 1 homolog [Dendronephthya gigantea]
MGLCKCPKKKVTNQFCFEHRVNVCEHCLVSGHSRCIVKSYLHWLQDSDYNPVCTLCNGNLSNGDTVRLTCYDVFHWDCLNKFASSLPPNTAPAGYTCPNCKVCVFPPNNLVSPVAEALKKKLINVNWARTGLGLPLAGTQNDAQDEVEHSGNHKELRNQVQDLYQQGNTTTLTRTSTPMHEGEAPAPAFTPKQHVVDIRPESQQHAAAAASPQATYPRMEKHGTGTVSRKIFDAREQNEDSALKDHDVDKYKRRGAVQWFSRWFGLRKQNRAIKEDSNSPLKRTAILVFLAILVGITLIVMMTRAGRITANNDPLLDPRANPNIRVEDDTA